jgi:hypothetical protein
MKLNYDVLKVGDIVCTTSLSWLAEGIRIKEAGWLNAFHTNIATHVGIIVPQGPEYVNMYGIAEMLSDGLKINALSDYINKGYLGDRIVCIKRFAPFQEEAIQKELVKQIFTWWQEGKKYDFEGVLKYVLPFLKDKDGKFYCSELLEWLAMHLAHQDLVEIKHEGDNVMPSHIQKSKLSTIVDGWSK